MLTFTAILWFLVAVAFGAVVYLAVCIVIARYFFSRQGPDEHELASDWSERRT